MITGKRAAFAALLLASLTGVLVVAQPASRIINVKPGARLQSVLHDAPNGATVVLGPGVHRGPVIVDHSLTLRGVPAARLIAPAGAEAVLSVSASGVRLQDLTVLGGVSGISIREANNVSVDAVVVGGAKLQGIEVVDASAYITGARVEQLTSSYAQGIEVRNSDGRPDTVIEDSLVTGGQEGIVSHVSEVTFRNNLVSGTTMRGIAVTEMSDGTVESNRVHDAAGTGLYCGDMSRCAFSNNQVGPVSAGDGGLSSAGWGLVVNYHATASSNGDALTGAAGTRADFVDSRFVAESPLESGEGWLALGPTAVAIAAALGGLAVAVLIAGHILRRTRVAARLSPQGEIPRSPRAQGISRAVWAALWLGIGVQGFHMYEHVLQVYRVHFDGVPGRGGLAGPAADAEVVHFVYNAAVLAMLVVVAVARTRGWAPSGNARLGDRLMGGAVIVQSYHMTEHSAKLVQHVVTGAKVNPGFLGNYIDLVWLHFSINLTVYAGFVGACLAYGWGWHRRAEGLLAVGELNHADMPPQAAGG
jgi:parallel beta-helix repeat protein